MKLSRDRWTAAFRSPPGVLAIALAVAMLLVILPSRWTTAIQNTAREILRPGQLAGSTVGRYGETAKTRLASHWHTIHRLAETRQEVDRLEIENRRLAAQLTALRLEERPPRDDSPEDRLLRAQCISANVLGHQARAFLQRHHLLDAGTADGIEPDSLVIDRLATPDESPSTESPSTMGPSLIDRGDDLSLSRDQLVLDGQNVLGKIVELGRNTSTVRPVTEPGYRDLVRVGTPSGPEGIVEGSGNRLARIRLIEVTEPVAVGDTVFATGGKGVLTQPLVYGHVERLQRPVGATHWDIWMRPAVTDEPSTVSVLRIELNPTRVSSSVGSSINQPMKH